MTAGRVLTASDIAFASSTKREFRRISDGKYQLIIPDIDTEFHVDQLALERFELRGNLTVYCGLKGAHTVDGVLSNHRFNFASLSGRDQLGRHLKQRANTGNQVDWVNLLEEFCIRVSKAEREGDAAKLLTEFDLPGPDDAYMVCGLEILKRHPQIIFGDGGTFKSYLGLYIAGTLSTYGVKVLYADWELGGADHHLRLSRLFPGQPPAVHYVRCQRPMVVAIDHLRLLIEQHGIEFVVCDSIAFACHGDPSGADIATEYARATRQFGDGVGSLHIAHVTKSVATATELQVQNQRPFGSTFWYNFGRSLWFVKRIHDANDSRRINIGLYDQKITTGAPRQPVGLEIMFDPEFTAVRRVDVSDIAELASTVQVGKRIDSALKSGAMTARELRDLVSDGGDTPTIATVRETLRRGRGRKYVQITNTPDGVHRWGLAERRSA